MNRLYFRSVFTLILLLSVTVLIGQAQHLKRKAAIGARFSAVADTPGLKVDLVSPELTGATIGLKAGDVVTTLNGDAIRDTAGLVALLRKYNEGDQVTVVAQRDGKPVTLTGTFTGRPKETAPGLDVIYTETQVGAEYHRTVIQKPANATGKLPAILFIQGIYCSSVIDLAPGHPYYDLLTPIAQKGYVVVRTERSGLSDSEGKPCGEIGFLEELDGYKAALKQIRALPYVDTSRIYVLGHSLGGISAPFVAADENVKGVITYGTAARLWSLYEIENVFDQSRIPEKIDYVELEAGVKLHQEFVHLFFGQKLKPEEIVKLHPEMKDYFGPDGTYASRAPRFFHELNDLKYAETWKKVTGKVLVLYGESDFQTNAENNRFIAEMVNSFRPGGAEFKMLPKIDHTFQTAGSKRESVELTVKRDYGHFNPVIVTEVLAGLAKMQ